MQCPKRLREIISERFPTLEPYADLIYDGFSISKQASSYGAYLWKKPVRLIAIDFDLK
jgi:hypothetical protein